MLTLNTAILFSTRPEDPKLIGRENGTSQYTLTLFIEERRHGLTVRLHAPVDVLCERAENVAGAVNSGDRVLVEG